MQSGEGPFLQAALFCEKVLTEQDGVNSLIRIFGRLTRRAQGPDAPDTLPPMMTPLTMVVAFTAGAARGRHSLTIRTTAPSGLRSPESPAMPLLFESEDRGTNAFVNLQIMIDQEGVYWFEVLLDGVAQTKIPLRVIYESIVTASR